MPTKRQTTMAKMQREREVAERRARKRLKKQEAAAARKAKSAGQALSPEGVGSVDERFDRQDAQAARTGPDE